MGDNRLEASAVGFKNRKWGETRSCQCDHQRGRGKITCSFSGEPLKSLLSWSWPSLGRSQGLAGYPDPPLVEVQSWLMVIGEWPPKMEAEAGIISIFWLCLGFFQFFEIHKQLIYSSSNFKSYDLWATVILGS